MNSKERLSKASIGEKVDRIPFAPTILEHSAKTINTTPSKIACDSSLLAKAHIEAYKVYKHDIVTIGVDVYNVEAEALGCEVMYFQDNSIPGISNHPYDDNFDEICFSKENGRISTIINAAKKVNNEIGGKVSVGIGICGPFSIAVELVGYEKLMMGCIECAEWVEELLIKVLLHQKEYCMEIISSNIGITIFESWATPPLITPQMYKKYVMPYEKELIRSIKGMGLEAVPLVIGGDTKQIVHDMLQTGTTLLVADFDSDIIFYTKLAKQYDILLRVNIDPKLVKKGDKTEILASVDKIIYEINGYKKFILGTGVVSYDTSSENIHLIRDYLNGKNN